MNSTLSGLPHDQILRMNMYRFHNPGLVPQTRVLAFAVLVVLGVAVLGIGLLMLSAQQRNIAALESRIARVGALPEAGAGNEAAFLAAESPNIAQTRLQTQVQELASAHALEVDVIRATEVEDQGRALALGILLNGVIPEDQLAGFLTALEAAEPKVLLTSMDIRRARVTSRRDPTRKLALRLGLEGLMLK